MKIGVAEFPGHVQMRPYMVENLLEPALTREFLGAKLVLVIDVILLDLDKCLQQEGERSILRGL
jgi:hypothetical protein